MYVCTECYKEYKDCPQYCDCGNDMFDEVSNETELSVENSSFENEEYEEEIVPPAAPPVRKKKKMTNEEAIEYFREREENQKSLIAAGVILILCLFIIFVFPPHKKPKMYNVKEKVVRQNYKIPSVETYWDNSLPSAYKAKDPLLNLPILNSHLGTISPVLREYLNDIAREFNRHWEKSMISVKEKKSYTTMVVFTINKEGIIDVKRIAKRSDNESLDNSVSLALTNTSSVEVPPSDYKGERVYINFIYTDRGEAMIQYPKAK